MAQRHIGFLHRGINNIHAEPGCVICRLRPRMVSLSPIHGIVVRGASDYHPTCHRDQSHCRLPQIRIGQRGGSRPGFRTHPIDLVLGVTAVSLYDRVPPAALPAVPNGDHLGYADPEMYLVHRWGQLSRC